MTLMFPQKLLDILVCPACRQPLAFRQGGEQQNFRCAACKRVYPVRDGIPILLVDEAKIEES
jgi:LSD1 subclass zinc finger protein